MSRRHFDRLRREQQGEKSRFSAVTVKNNDLVRGDLSVISRSAISVLEDPGHCQGDLRGRVSPCDCVMAISGDPDSP